ncbi:hypothetical protein FACS189452_05230 [Bacteroidia bacterium]|nr:hypothetical protein FACS189452_05230 [Bacteroidia bacterium]GHT81015.1 hypothetical protein FACS189467_4350 [Bacteroidia bacterium]
MKNLYVWAAAALIAMAAPCAYAQNECSSAVPITIGVESSAQSAGTDYWYKIELDADKAYAFEWQNSGTGSFEVYSTCGGTRVNGNYSIYEINTAGTYYIKARSYDAGGKFKVVEVTDNRLCANAQIIALNDTLTTTASFQYWYTIALTAGKSYAVNWINGRGSIMVVNGCPTNNGVGCGVDDCGRSAAFTVNDTRTYYIDVSWAEGFAIAELDPTDNRVCANAQTIALDDTVTLATDNNYWYKIALTAGKAYNIKGADGSNLSLQLYSTCSSSSEITSGENFIYAPSSSGTYYIKANSQWGSKFTVKDTTLAASDNRICANADNLALNTESPALPQQRTSYWYQVNLAAGKSYSIDWQNSGSGSFEVYSTCGGTRVNGNYSIYEISTAGTYYISAYSYNVNGTFKVSEVTDNRLCTNAQTIALDDTIAPTPDDIYYWYKITLTAGKVYDINSSNRSLQLYSTCGDNWITSSRNFIYSPSSSGTYYIRTYALNTNDKFTVKEITIDASDNRICANAQAITVGAEKTPTATDGTHYWYKVDLAAGTTYEIARVGTDNITAQLYESCGGSVLTGTNYSNNTYTSSSAGTYYVEAYTGNTGAKFKITEVTDNRGCAHAESLTLDTESPTLPQQYNYYWYKVNLAAGKGYTIDWQNSGNGSSEVYSTCGGTRVNGNGGIYEITTAGTYYIRAYSYDVDGKFKVVEVTDNRVCAYADNLALDTESPALPQQYAPYWYKVNLAAGKSYFFEKTSGSGGITVYNSCGGNPVMGEGVYTATESGTFYLRLSGYAADYKTKISEVTDNRVCAYATTLALDTESPAPPKTGPYWYKVDLQAGKPYLFEKTSGNGGFDLYNSCGGDWVANETIRIYTATESGTFYLLLSGGNVDYKAKISEVTDNQVCAYAAPLTLATETTPPAANKGYWYKTTLQAGKDYEMQWAAGSGSIYLYNSCGGSSLTGGSGTQLYRATASGTYYIQVYADSPTSKFLVSETTIAATDNRICENAKTLAVGAESDALSVASYWYKLNLTAGAYIFETTSGSTGYNGLYSGGCSSNTEVSMNNITETGVYYLRMYSHAADSKFKVSANTDNRLCVNATAIALDAQITSTDEYWHTINLQAGRTYNVQWTAGDGWIDFYDACNGTQLATVFSSGDYLAPNSGTYYIRVHFFNPATFTITQTEDAVITDNRICTYAQPIALNETITPTETGTYYWYKIDLQAGKGYKFEGKAGGDIWFYLHNACGSAVLTDYNLWSTRLSYLYAAEASDTYYVRVYAYQNGSTLKISEVTTPTVQSVAIVAPNGMSIQKGGAQKFEARVTALGGAAQTVTWSVTGTASSIAADGTLSIGAGETAAILVVTATSTADNSKKASITVIVTDDVLVEAVLGVSVSPNTTSVAKGSTRQFSVVVLVQGNAAQTVTWSVSGGTAGTSISATGLLTVAAGETASTLTVTATSTADASKKGTASVTVTAAGTTEPEPTDPTDPTAVEAQRVQKLLVYPNPVSDQITITSDQWNAGDKVEIYNVNGTKVFETPLSIVNYPLSINIAHLPAGIYIVKVGNRTAKVVKQ